MRSIDALTVRVCTMHAEYRRSASWVRTSTRASLQLKAESGQLARRWQLDVEKSILWRSCAAPYACARFILALDSTNQRLVNSNRHHISPGLKLVAQRSPP